MEELIVDGKNVLQPVNLDANKNEIQRQRRNVPSQVSLNHFKENVGIFKANVKGEDVNDLVTQIQDCFVTLNQRDAKVYDELDTIFRVIEDIHDGTIKGIIAAIKSAQEAIAQSDYAIEQIKETLLILQDFKTQLEENTIHLNDIDALWDASQLLERDLSALEETVKQKNSEHDKHIKKIIEFKTSMEKRKHIKDVDKMYQDIERLDGDFKKNSQDNQKNIEQINGRLSVFEEFQAGIQALSHYNDLDIMWDDVQRLTDSCSNIEAALNNKHVEISRRVDKLSGFISKLENMDHILDIDTIFQSVSDLKVTFEENKKANEAEISALKENIDALTKQSNELAADISKVSRTSDNNSNQISAMQEDYEKRFEAINEFLDRLKECEHLLDVDKAWSFSHDLETRVVEVEKRTEVLENVQAEVETLKTKLHTAYLVIGGTAAVLVVQLLLNILGVI